MNRTTLIVPGFRGSGPDHWQTWLEARRPDARRVTGIDWDAPVLAAWAAAIRQEIRRSTGPVWLVAHSFGCLASVAASVGHETRIAGALLVAPADPCRFTPFGPRDLAEDRGQPSLADALPRRPLGFPSLIVASRNDPWMTMDAVRAWAERWESRILDLGNAGHINVESGHGPWPGGLSLLRTLQRRRQAGNGAHNPGFSALHLGFSSFAAGPATARVRRG